MTDETEEKTNNLGDRQKNVLRLAHEEKKGWKIQKRV